MKAQPVILSTKMIPEDANALLRAKGIQVIDQDFISIEYLKSDLEPHALIDTVLISSKNAVNSLIEFDQISFLQGKDIYCVGESIPKILGPFNIEVKNTFYNAKELADFIVAQPIKEVSYLAGNLSRKELPEILNQNGVTILTEITYHTSLTPKKIHDDLDAILFYSPSGIESYITENRINDEAIICIGKTTQAAAQTYSQNTILADHHKVSSVIQKTIELFQVQ